MGLDNLLRTKYANAGERLEHILLQFCQFKTNQGYGSRGAGRPVIVSNFAGAGGPAIDRITLCLPHLFPSPRGHHVA